MPLQIRQDLLADHFVKLFGNARSEIKPAIVDLHFKTTSGTNWVINHLGIGWQHRLFAITFWHRSTTPNEKGFQLTQPICVQNQRLFCCLSRSLGSDIIAGRA
ncbi:Uncharacterised protein [Vibrio cholerae]|uniref:Uncharacterized protein n=1 Tax=Vibrio cholerae TaxID=666 RepID=A0A656AN20_VIBCL|nr:Uncharacterised protein [Vibrio cholerae]CSD21859.1 Uncharacterised protein [Vibrio cholerae]